MRRRDFLRGVVGVVAGATVAPAVIKAKTKPKSEYPSDGKYLDADEVKCMYCGGMIEIEKGFYVPGDLIECPCGNRARFILNAKVDLKDPNGMWAKDMAKHCQEGMDKTIIDILKGKELI